MNIVLYIGMTLDGYIADKNGSVNFLYDYSYGDNYSKEYDKFYASVDGIILGNTTYKQIVNELSPNNWPYTGKKTFVLTSDTSDKVDKEEIFFTSKNVTDLLKEAEKLGLQNIWIVGGGKVIKEFIDNNLITEYRITLLPTILGSGIKLFHEGKERVELELISCEKYLDATEIIYKRK